MTELVWPMPHWKKWEQREEGCVYPHDLHYPDSTTPIAAGCAPWKTTHPFCWVQVEKDD